MERPEQTVRTLAAKAQAAICMVGQPPNRCSTKGNYVKKHNPRVCRLDAGWRDHAEGTLRAWIQRCANSAQYGP